MVRVTLTALAAASLISAASLTLAEEWRGPLLDREVGMEIPAEFAATPAFADASMEAAIVEFLPGGETLEAWSQMLTLNSFVDASGQPADQAVLNTVNNLAAGYGGACPSSFAAEDLGAPAVPGAEASFSAWLACGDVGGAGYSESMAVLILATGGRVYTVQWAERGPGSSGPVPFDLNHWLPRLDALMAFQL